MWQKAEGWALILKQLHTGQQSSTSETALAEISPSCCFCTFWLIALTFEFRSKMEDWWGIAVRQQYVCVSENLPTLLIFCSFRTAPTRYTRKHTQFFDTQQKSWTSALCKCLSFGCSPWLCLGCCVKGGKGLALELVAMSHWWGHIRAAMVVLLTAGLSCEEVDGVVQNYVEASY